MQVSVVKFPTSSASTIETARARLRDVIQGKERVIDLALGAFIGGGHLLLEGPPGSGKTSLARGLAQVFGGAFRRVQMTSDLLPSDILGFLRLRPGSGELEFRQGPIFSNFLLVDELNRSSPKTQSALLEAMAEGTVTVDGTSHPLMDPFFVVATQNPYESQGVYPLAESQLDRFMLQLTFDFPGASDELRILRGGEGTALAAPFGPEQARALRACGRAVHVEDSVLEYCLSLVRETRELPGVSCGVSVRGGLQLVAAARGLAVVRGREFVLPEDIRDLAESALAHRLSFAEGYRSSEERRQLIRALLERLPSPK